MNISASWNLDHGDSASGSLNVGNAAADVTLDIFADEDINKANQTGQQKYEIMIWYAHWGNSSVPIGTPVKNKKKSIVALVDNTAL